MRQGTRGAVLGAAMLLPGAAVAGTPAQEADRCSRVLAALKDGDAAAMLATVTERYKPEDIPERFVLQQKLHVAEFAATWAKRGGFKAAAEPLPDMTVPGTGDVLRRQKWTDGTGRAAYVGCVFYPGLEQPWLMTVTLSSSDNELIKDLSDHVVVGKAD